MVRFDSTRYIDMLRRWWWLLVIAVCLAGGVSYLSVRSLPPIYVTSTTILVGAAITATNPNSGDFSTASQLADTYAQLTQREPILDATVKALNLPISWDQLRTQVLVVHGLGAQTFEIRVLDVDPHRAQAIAQAIANQLVASSPTEQMRKTLDERRQFIRAQLDMLQRKIDRASLDLEEKQRDLEEERSARGVLDRQDEIRAIELNLSSWRASYASLLNTDQNAGGPNTLTVIEPATLPRQPAGSDARWQIATAGVAGLFLAIGAVLALEFLDNTIKTKEELERLTGVPALSRVWRFASLRKRAGPVLSMTAPDAPEAEPYRLLSTGIRLATLNGTGTTPIVLITSPALGDGKSVTAANLAAVLAQQGHEVLLVDLDLRHATLHQFFEVANDRGLTSVFLNRGLRTSDCIVNTSLPLLKLLPSGPLPPNPGNFIARLGGELLHDLREMADFIIIDCPPVLAATDAVTLGSLADATVLVVRAGVTRRDSIRSARELLERANARIIGTVLNGVSRRDISRYGYGAGRPRRGWATLMQRFNA